MKRILFLLLIPCMANGMRLSQQDISRIKLEPIKKRPRLKPLKSPNNRQRKKRKLPKLKRTHNFTAEEIKCAKIWGIVLKVKEKYPEKTEKQLDNLFKNLKYLFDIHEKRKGINWKTQI